MLFLINKAVTLYLPEKKSDGSYARFSTPGIVVGYDPSPEPMPENFNPSLHVAYLHPERGPALSGSDWRFAFDRQMSVKHLSEASEECVPGYEFPSFAQSLEVIAGQSSDIPSDDAKPKLVKKSKSAKV